MKRACRSTAFVALLLLSFSGVSYAGGKVTYPDGTPVAGGKVHIHLQDVGKYDLLTDAQGKFDLPKEDFLDAFVQIQAPDGKDYATVNLPVAIFEGAEVAVVLQPKK